MAEPRKTSSSDAVKTRGKASKRPEKKTSLAKKTAADSKATTEPTAGLTDEERRVKKNAYIREWRKTHSKEYAAYMKAWREKKAKGASGTAKRKAALKKTAKEPAAPENTMAAVAEAPTA